MIDQEYDDCETDQDYDEYIVIGDHYSRQYVKNNMRNNAKWLCEFIDYLTYKDTDQT
jgi:hypothetical protein